MSNKSWPMVRFAEILRPNKRPYELGPTEDANLVGMRLYGLGPFHRELKPAFKIRKKSHFVIRANDVIYNKLFAWKGTFGIVPHELDGMFVSDKFPTYELDCEKVDRDFLRWYFRQPPLWDQAREMSTGSAALSKLTLNPPKFLELTIPLPPLEEQQRIVAHIDRLATLIGEAGEMTQQVDAECQSLLRSKFYQVIDGVKREKMGVVAPLVRRRVELKPGTEYPELGIRSFGKGTFHKPALDYMSVGTKKLFRIEPSDLLFSNVFAWEGAIAVAQTHDEGRVGSHRFITCIPQPDLATADFLCFFFLTPAGLQKIGRASPGGAGRNRTLGLKKLAEIEVPVPPLESQIAFGRLLQKVRDMDAARQSTHKKLDSLLPSILDRAFKGEL